MSPQPTSPADPITVLVFKDNYAARTFQISTRWISKLAIVLGIFCFLMISSVFVSVKYYRIASKADPSRVQDLEQELAEVKATLKGPEPLLSPMAGSPSTLFSMFPEGIAKSLPDPKGLKFDLQTPQVSWQNKTLKIHFALQYTHDDQKSQQGRIIILARGLQNLVAYPSAIFNSAGSETLINLSQGETFSVSRYREVNAELGPIASPSLIKEIEIFIFSREGQLLRYQKIASPEVKESTQSDE